MLESQSDPGLTRLSGSVNGSPGGLNPDKQPDLLIEGRVFDTYTPETNRLDGIWDGIETKVADKQTHRIVVDLRNTTQTTLRCAQHSELDPSAACGKSLP